MLQTVSSRGPVHISDPGFQAQSSLKATKSNMVPEILWEYSLLIIGLVLLHLPDSEPVDAPAALLYPAAKSASMFLPPPCPSAVAAHFCLSTTVSLFCDCRTAFYCWEEYTELHS